jgi:Zn-dependent M32 family carboxypeptidase
MIELDTVLNDDSQAIADWIREQQRGDIYDRYEIYRECLGNDEEPLDFDSWLNR